MYSVRGELELGTHCWLTRLALRRPVCKWWESAISLRNYWREQCVSRWDLLWVIRWKEVHGSKISLLTTVVLVTLLEFDARRESQGLQWSCPGALLSGHLSLGHHCHRLHHEEDGHVLRRSLQVRAGTRLVRWWAFHLTWSVKGEEGR